MANLQIEIQEKVYEALMYGASSVQDIRAYVTNFVSPSLVTEDVILGILGQEPNIETTTAGDVYVHH